MRNKYEHFTDNEIYILSRQAIEGSYDIVSEYPADEIEVHERLLNELIDERKRRDYCVSRDWDKGK